MAACSKSSSECRSSSFSVAHVRIISSVHTSESRLARVAVSCRIYWKYVKDSEGEEPSSLLDFKGHHSLIVDRIPDDAIWRNVEDIVTARHDDKGSSIVVPGKLRGPSRWKNAAGNIRLVLTAGSVNERDGWLRLLRVRVAPMSLLKSRVLELATSNAMSDARSQIELMLVGDRRRNYFRVSVTETESSAVPSSAPPPEKIEKAGWLSNITLHGANVLGAIATAVKMRMDNVSDNLGDLAANAERVADVAKDVGDATRCVVALSSVFQLVVLGARLVHMFAEASRGYRQLPKCFAQLVVLLKYVLESTVKVLDPAVNVEDILKDNVFDVLEGVLDTMEKIEEQAMRVGISQLFNAKVVDEVETKVGMLKREVVTVVHSAKLADMNSRPVMYSPLPSRSKMSKYFVGRKKEISWLERTLTRYGSAVISQYGGVGKTQLMSAFTDWAERERNISDIFWLVADGDASSITSSLAAIAEKLLGRKMSAQMRDNPNVVVDELERELDSLGKHWFVCLDNVDNAADPKVSAILEAVCSIAERSEKKGWVLITTRQSHPTIWESMESEQMLKLGPLSAEDSMVLLWRLVKRISSNNERDEDIWLKLKNFKDEDVLEFNSLGMLCENLAGLPLALVQAAAYIKKQELSFLKYHELYGKAGKKAKLEELLPKTSELGPVKEEQRAILTTWSMNVNDLSPGAKQLLRIVSMLGNQSISESFMKSLIHKTEACDEEEEDVDDKYRRMLVGELVHGSSLLQKGKLEGEVIFDMHRLIRLFVLTEMKLDMAVWNAIFSLALSTTHFHLEDLFGSRFFVPPSTLERSHSLLVPHTMAIVLNTSQSTTMELSFAELRNVHVFAAKVFQKLWREFEAEEVWYRLLRIMKTHYGENANNEAIAWVLNELGDVLLRIGKLDKAANILRQSLEMKQVVFSDKENNLSIAKTLDHLGSVHERQRNLDEAVEYYLKSLRIKHAVHGRDAVEHDILCSINCLANVYLSQKKFHEARKMRLQSIEMARAIHGQNSNHTDIASTLMGLGGLCLQEGNYHGAVEKFQESLEMRRIIYGSHANHPDVAALLNNLGYVYGKQSNFDDALDMHMQSLEMNKSVYGRRVTHPSIALVLRNIGVLYQNQGKHDYAYEFHRQSLEMRRSIYGRSSDHPDVADSLQKLGIASMDLSKLDEAKKMFEASRRMFHRILGDNKDHPFVRETERCMSHVIEKLTARALVAAGPDEEKLEKAGFFSKDGLFSIVGNGVSPLQLCACNDLAETAEILLKRGVRVDTLDGFSRTPLMYASGKHNIDVIRLLKKYNADLARRDENGNSALHFAFFKRGPRLVTTIQLLCDSVANVNATNNIGESVLHILAKSEYLEDDSDIAEVLLERGSGVNSRDKALRTPLMLAARMRYINILSALIKNSADLDLQDEDGDTALHFALIGCGPRLPMTIQLLCDSGAKVNARNHHGLTVLHMVAVCEHLEDLPNIVEILLERGADINERDEQLRTPLMLASENLHVNALKVLIKNGADPKLEDEIGRTALHHAFYFELDRRLAMTTQLLCDSGANINALHILVKDDSIEDISDYAKILFENGANANVRDKDLKTPLMLASRKRHVNFCTLELLVKNGADPRLEDKNGNTALHFAFFNVNDCCCLATTTQLLCDSGASVNASNNNGWTALHILASRENLEDKDSIMKILMERGAEVNSRDKVLRTPLMLAFEKSNLDFFQKLKALEMLIENGADPKLQDKNGRTALHYAFFFGWHLEVKTRLLCDAGANVNAYNNIGWTVLHILASRENLEDKDSIMKIVLERGAEVNARDNKLRTPLMLASVKPYVNLLKVLIANGADPRLEDEDGDTALHFAFFNVNDCCCLATTTQLLCDSGASVNASNNNGWTVLHILATRDSSEDMSDVANFLLEHGAEVNARDEIMRTPLMLVSRRRHVNMLNVLIRKGGDPKLKDRNGRNALHYATYGSGPDMEETIRILRGAGADVNAKDNNDNTVLHSVEVLKNRRVIDTLIGLGADINGRDMLGNTPLHTAAIDKQGVTPLQAAKAAGYDKIVSLLGSHAVRESRVDEDDGIADSESNKMPVMDEGKRNSAAWSIESMHEKKKRKI